MSDDASSCANLETVTLIAELDAPFPADVFLFHPDNPALFLVGTYLLDEVTRVRLGKICVYRLRETESASDPANNADLLVQVACDAVLDMKWFRDLLYVAHSTGSLSVYRLSDSAIQPTTLLLTSQKLVLPSAEVLIMSLSVSERGILTSHSDGTLGLWTHELVGLSNWRVSDLEVWTQAWGHDESTVYAGSDDGVFSVWDPRCPSGDEAVAKLSNSRSHSAGVTAILPRPSASQVLTGSYDDHIRRFDLRNLRRAVTEVNLGGGVWRIIPRSGGQLVTCCMYDGAKVVREEGDFEVVKRWRGHASMVYGGDVSGKLVGTCSFYDKKVCVWR